jgi:hypothetical protein
MGAKELSVRRCLQGVWSADGLLRERQIRSKEPKKWHLDTESILDCVQRVGTADKQQVDRGRPMLVFHFT